MPFYKSKLRRNTIMKLFRTLAVFLALLIPAFAATQTLQNVTVDAPVTLTTDGPETSTTTSGNSAGSHYTRTNYMGEQSNGDIYMVNFGKYPFQLATTTNDDMTQAFIEGVPGSKVLNSRATTFAGLDARSTVLELVQDGRTMRIFLIVTHRGDTAYIFAFGTFMDTQGTDNAVVARFFANASIN
jgi:hypothetical protein